MRSFGYGIAHVTSGCPAKLSSWIDKPIFTLPINLFASSNRAITFGRRARSSKFKRWSRTHRLYYSTIITIVELVCLSKNRLTRIYSVSEGLRRFLLFSCLGVKIIGIGNPPQGGFLITQLGSLQYFWSHDLHYWVKIRF